MKNSPSMRGSAPRSAVRGILMFSNTQLFKYIRESVVHFGILTSHESIEKFFTRRESEKNCETRFSGKCHFTITPAIT